MTSRHKSLLTRRDLLTVTAGAALAARSAADPPVADPPGTTDPGTADLPRIRSDEDLERLLAKLSNWGRWGEGDRLGTLNFLTPERRRAAAGLVRSGRSISLARRSGFAELERGQHEVTVRPMGSRDFVAFVFHGFEATHLDALSHVFADDERMYNGVAKSAVTERSAAELGVEVMAAAGIVGRGVLLDVAALRGGALEPGTPLFPSDLEAAEAAHRVRVSSGDLLFVRTGAGRRNTRERRSGLHPECLLWLRAREVALIGSDGDSDVAPLAGFDRWGSAMHTVAIPYLGMPLLDNADLEALSVACAAEQRWAFLATIAPLRIEGMTGSPVNPMALL